MKKYYLIIVIFLFSSSINAQVINIPDAYFKNKLVTSTTSNGVAKDSNGNSIKIDANNNGEIEVNEIQNITAINVAGFSPNNLGGIVSMNGIQNFTNLKSLKCSSNHITSLDLTALTQLEVLDCAYNNLTSLNVTGLTNLKNLQCQNNNLSSLATTGLSNLRILYTSNNGISALNLNDSPQLVTLWCTNDSLTSLDLSVLPVLETVICENNHLNSLNLMGLSHITSINCGWNNLTGLNLSGLSTLQFLGMEANQISSIDFSTLSSIQRISCGGNPLTSVNLNGLSTLNQLFIGNTLISTLDCGQSGVTQLKCSDNPNLTYINVKNNHYSYSDPDLLYFGFTFENLPALTGICLDSGEESNLNYTNYNTSQNVVVYTGTNCDVVVPFIPMSADGFSAMENFKIYPNPVNDVLNVTMKDGASIKTMYVYNNLGQLVQTVSKFNYTTSNALDVSSLKSGYYFLEIVSDNGRSTEKFIKN